MGGPGSAEVVGRRVEMVDGKLQFTAERARGSRAIDGHEGSHGGAGAQGIFAVRPALLVPFAGEWAREALSESDYSILSRRRSNGIRIWRWTTTGCAPYNPSAPPSARPTSFGKLTGPKKGGYALGCFFRCAPMAFAASIACRTFSGVILPASW